MSRRGKREGLVTEFEGGEWESAEIKKICRWSSGENNNGDYKAQDLNDLMSYLEVGEHYEGEYRDNRQVCDHWACWSFPEEKCCHGKNPNMYGSDSFARVAENNILRHSIDDAMCSEN